MNRSRSDENNEKPRCRGLWSPPAGDFLPVPDGFARKGAKLGLVGLHKERENESIKAQRVSAFSGNLMQEQISPNATIVLAEASRGNSAAAAKLLPLVYDELRALAASALRRERKNHTLQPTALVHEAFLRLIDQTHAEYKSRTHFFAVGAQAIRRILVDHARQHHAAKRGGDWLKVTLDQAAAAATDEEINLLGLDEALTKLASLDERQSKVVELRFFGGLSVEETAAMLEVSPRTVEEDWRMARAWLKREMEKQL